ncbi:helix-turn-helix transcriptional regulator [Nocardia sp. CWNU-33]|uniref:helix-turn-helix transcriptional regulator n=1 Tax=Nocardia sp. CWNU-33 TaxID=3392117 RepID=UPI00398F0C2A
MALAHPGLHEYLDSANELWGQLFAPTFRIEFADYDELVSRSDISGAIIMLPVNAEYEAESLHTVRAQHAMGLIVAVTDDVTGHSTYSAIRFGADFVINVAIPGERQAEMLRAQLGEFMHSARIDTRPALLGAVTDHSASSRGQHAEPRRDDAPEAADLPPLGISVGRSAWTEFDIRLLRMLRTPMTVAEIARANYLSERSIYRRIRNLYNALGVVSRTELIRSTGGEYSAGRSVEQMEALR